MEINDKYAMKFVSDLLTREKYNELHRIAVYLRDFRNKLSKEIFENVFDYLEIKPLDYVTIMREKYKDEIPSCFDKQLYSQVITCYKNKFKVIIKSLEFENVIFKGFDFYKRKTKNHQKGEFKKVIIERKKTKFSICLTYLARYCKGIETIDYIRENLNNVDDNKKKFYLNILHYIDKFGFDKLFRLALLKRERILREKNKKPIEFKSLSFNGRCRKKDIIGYNSNYKSVINSFISLSGFDRKTMDIPVKFSKDYHGRMSDYHKKTNDYEYVITFNEKWKQVNVYLIKDGKRFIPEVNEDSILVGIDVNVKHNLLTLSDGKMFDYDRNLVNDFCKLCLKLDKIKEEQGKDYEVGKKYQQKLDKLREKVLKSEQQIISDMCKYLQSKGVTHIVMEDLDNGFGKCYVKDKNNEDINFNRIVKVLRLSSLKDEIEHIARKYDIAVSTVHSCYTSKMCPICGCIEDENRPTQEYFSCIECGHSENADLNAAINIRNRVAEAVLREHLLKQIDNGTYEPKNLKREKVKEVLLSYRTSLVKGRGSKFS